MACLCILAGTLLAGCGAAEDTAGGGEEPVNRQFFAMDTYMTVTAYGENAAEATEAAEAEVNRLDAMLSTGNEDSEISGLNSKGRAVLSEEAGSLVERGLAMYAATEGCFDIAIYPIMAAWGFTDQNYRVPTDEELKELLPLTDASRISCHDAESKKGEPGVEVSFQKDGMAIDLGGIAKGYTSSKIMDIYREHGVTSGMVSLGGNVQVLGTKPDGSNWRVAVQDPGADDIAAEDGASADSGEDSAAAGTETQTYLGILEAADMAIITSGAYERNFTQSGKLYHHIIDPKTGKPADSGLRSVTIVSKDGTLADALSTSLYIMGKEKAIDYWHEHKDQFDFILMDKENELYVSEPIAEQFISETYHVTTVK